jgi:hypothetical protein
MTGLLWQRDRADEPLEVTIRNAAARYAERFGEWPGVAFVPVSATEGSLDLVADRQTHTIEVRPSPRISQGCVMVAVEGRDLTLPAAVPTGAAQAEPPAPEPLVHEQADALEPASLLSDESHAALEAAETPTEPTLTESPAAAQPTLPLEATPPTPPPTPRIKRRSTMLWDPARQSPPETDEAESGHDAQQLSLWE